MTSRLVRSSRTPNQPWSGTNRCGTLRRPEDHRCLLGDKPFLRENGDGISLLAFPEKIDITDQTASFFPELNAAPSALTTGYRKKQFRPEAILPHSLLVFDRAISADHFQLLAGLVAGADCYRLAFGRDILNLPTLVDSLLR